MAYKHVYLFVLYNFVVQGSLEVDKWTVSVFLGLRFVLDAWISAS